MLCGTDVLCDEPLGRQNKTGSAVQLAYNHSRCGDTYTYYENNGGGTSPVSIGGIVAGKFLAAFVVYLAAISITLVMSLVTWIYSSPDWSVLLGNITGLALLGAAFIAIGIFCSCCTESQPVSAVICFAALLFVTFLSAIGAKLPFEFISKIADKLAFSERYYAFTYGIFDISNVLFFISAVFVFLFLTVRVTERRRFS